MLVTPLVLIQIFSKRMLVDWPKCGSDPQDEGHLACLCFQDFSCRFCWKLFVQKLWHDFLTTTAFLVFLRSSRWTKETAMASSQQD